MAGLLPGQNILPPSVTAARSCADYDGGHCRADRVYLTIDASEAAVYAALAASEGGGDVYEVDPVGELEPDPPGVVGTGSFAAPAATVVAIVRRTVRPEEAFATISAFLLTLAADDAAGMTPSVLRMTREPLAHRRPRIVADALSR